MESGHRDIAPSGHRVNNVSRIGLLFARRPDLPMTRSPDGPMTRSPDGPISRYALHYVERGITMTTTAAVSSSAPQFVRGKIVDTQIKVSVDATRPLPLVCALYAVESSEGVWLCAYYGANRGVFDYLPRRARRWRRPNWALPFGPNSLSPRTSTGLSNGKSSRKRISWLTVGTGNDADRVIGPSSHRVIG